MRLSGIAIETSEWFEGFWCNHIQDTVCGELSLELDNPAEMKNPRVDGRVKDELPGRQDGANPAQLEWRTSFGLHIDRLSAARVISTTLIPQSLKLSNSHLSLSIGNIYRPMQAFDTAKSIQTGPTQAYRVVWNAKTATHQNGRASKKGIKPRSSNGLFATGQSVNFRNVPIWQNLVRPGLENNRGVMPCWEPQDKQGRGKQGRSRPKSNFFHHRVGLLLSGIVL